MNTQRDAVLTLALLIDILLGDPPNTFHPVAWMGHVINLLKKRAPGKGSRAQLAYGGLIVFVGGSLFATLGYGLSSLFKAFPRLLSWLCEAILLKSTIGLRGLDQAAGEVQDALQEDDLPRAQKLVRFHLVSRQTAQLNASQVAAAAIESVAENASDGIIAPLFYYVLGGLPAALGYRFLNTADSMLGYRDPAREWLGKIPARIDDILNFLPARLTGGLIALAATLHRKQGKRSFYIMHHEAAKTDSPNAGVPMSAMAGALDVELEKVGQYKLGEGNRPPTPHDIQESRSLLKLATLLAGVLFVLLTWWRGRD